MRVEELDITNKHQVIFVENLYIESFPIYERRPVEKMFDLYRNNSKFTVLIVIKDEQPLGFLTYWDLDEFVYAEHFAISPETRNGGFGRKSMEFFVANKPKPVILEVEIPDNELSIRRIGFYERIGFKLWEEIDYKQPPYHAGDELLPMKLMTLGDINLQNDYEAVRNKIYKEVYNYSI